LPSRACFTALATRIKLADIVAIVHYLAGDDELVLASELNIGASDSLWAL
jgi:hypothetical protein